jgi:hypothetical protein
MGDMSRGWRIATLLFVAVNLIGGVFAIGMGEARHAVGHAVALLVGIGLYTGWRVRSKPEGEKPATAEPDARLQYLQESVDAIAIEVERIGEAQRFSEKLRTKQVETPPENESPPKKT